MIDQPLIDLVVGMSHNQMHSVLEAIFFIIFHFNGLATFLLVLWIEVLLCIEFLDLGLDLLFLILGFILLLAFLASLSFLETSFEPLLCDSFVSSLHRIELDRRCGRVNHPLLSVF